MVLKQLETHKQKKKKELPHLPPHKNELKMDHRPKHKA